MKPVYTKPPEIHRSIWDILLKKSRQLCGHSPSAPHIDLPWEGDGHAAHPQNPAPELWNALTPEAEELRLRVGRTPGVVIAGREHPLSASIVIRATLDQIVGAASGHSSFAALGDGYLSLPGGHRLGFCGSAVVKDGHIAHFRQLSALNLRIAREVRGVADPILCSSPLKNTLLVGPPGAEKPLSYAT